EPSPERAEAVEDEFGVAAMGGGSQADCHLLNDARHQEGQNDKGQEKSDAETCARCGVGEHAGPVVFAEHDKDAGSDEKPEQPCPRAESSLRTGFPDALAVVSAVDVFVRDFNLGGGFSAAEEQGSAALEIRGWVGIGHPRSGGNPQTS